jgi:hypothetical protein
MQRVEDQSDLGALGPQSFRSPVLVERTRTICWAVGLPAPSIMRRLAWPVANVWMPDHVVTYVRRHKPGVLDVFLLVTELLERPDDVYWSHEDPDRVALFSAAAPRLQAKGLLRVRRTPYVEAAVELRSLRGVSVARLFHLSPMNRIPEGKQLWP